MDIIWNSDYLEITNYNDDLQCTSCDQYVNMCFPHVFCSFCDKYICHKCFPTKKYSIKYKKIQHNIINDEYVVNNIETCGIKTQKIDRIQNFNKGWMFGDTSIASPNGWTIGGNDTIPNAKYLCNPCVNVIKKFQKCKLMNYTHYTFNKIKKQIFILLMVANTRHIVSKNVIIAYIIPYFINNYLKK